MLKSILTILLTLLLCPAHFALAGHNDCALPDAGGAVNPYDLRYQSDHGKQPPPGMPGSAAKYPWVVVCSSKSGCTPAPFTFNNLNFYGVKASVAGGGQVRVTITTNQRVITVGTCWHKWKKWMNPYIVVNASVFPNKIYAGYDGFKGNFANVYDMAANETVTNIVASATVNEVNKDKGTIYKFSQMVIPDVDIGLKIKAGGALEPVAVQNPAVPVATQPASPLKIKKSGTPYHAATGNTDIFGVSLVSTTQADGTPNPVAIPHTRIKLPGNNTPMALKRFSTCDLSSFDCPSQCFDLGDGSQQYTAAVKNAETCMCDYVSPTNCPHGCDDGGCCVQQDVLLENNCGQECGTDTSQNGQTCDGYSACQTTTFSSTPGGDTCPSIYTCVFNHACVHDKCYFKYQMSRGDHEHEGDRRKGQNDGLCSNILLCNASTDNNEYPNSCEDDDVNSCDDTIHNDLEAALVAVNVEPPNDGYVYKQKAENFALNHVQNGNGTNGWDKYLYDVNKYFIADCPNCLNPPAHATLCAGDGAGFFGNVDATILPPNASCNDSAKCQYVCDAPDYIAKADLSACELKCGNGICDAPEENFITCPQDCNCEDTVLSHQQSESNIAPGHQFEFTSNLYATPQLFHVSVSTEDLEFEIKFYDASGHVVLSQDCGHRASGSLTDPSNDGCGHDGSWDTDTFTISYSAYKVYAKVREGGGAGSNLMTLTVKTDTTCPICTNPPKNATLCTGDNTGFNGEVASTIVSSCNGDAKCQYTCNGPDYIYNASTNSCEAHCGNQTCQPSLGETSGNCTDCTCGTTNTGDWEKEDYACSIHGCSWMETVVTTGECCIQWSPDDAGLGRTTHPNASNLIDKLDACCTQNNRILQYNYTSSSATHTAVTYNCLTCGNNTCDDNETSNSCPDDCHCGDGECNYGETWMTCNDCAAPACSGKIYYDYSNGFYYTITGSAAYSPAMMNASMTLDQRNALVYQILVNHAAGLNISNVNVLSYPSSAGAYGYYTCSGPYSCEGNTISGATLCDGDNTGLSANVTRTAVTSCTDTKCEYKCPDGYTVSGNTCQAPACSGIPAHSSECDGSIPYNTTATIYNHNSCPSANTNCAYHCDSGYYKSGNTCVAYACTGSAIAGATLCSGDDTGLSENTAITAVTACGSAKCEYKCPDGYTVSGNTCQPPVPTCTGYIDPNAVLCGGSDQGLTVSTPRTLVEDCGDNKCEYYCPNNFQKQGYNCLPTI